MTTPNDRSSSSRSLNAYEVWTGYILDVFSHTGHRRFPLRSLIAKWPQSWFPHTYWIVPSDSSKRRSLITIAAPWPMRPSFRRLPREDLDRSARADVQFSGDHVVQLLVVDHAHEDLRGDHAARAAVVQDLLPVRPEAVLLEGLPHGVLPLAAEWRPVDEATFEGSDLAPDLFEDMGDRHPRRDRVGIDDQVGNDPLRGERQVLLRCDQADHTLLAVAGGELVPQFRHPQVADLNLRKLRTVLALGEHDGIDPSTLAVAHGDRGLAAFLRRQEVRLLLEETRRARLPDQDVAAIDEDLRRDETVIRREVRVRQVGTGPADVGRRNLEMVLLAAGISALLRAVRPHEGRPAEAPIDGGVVHHDRVLHVVPMVRHDRDHEVLARGTLVERHELHRVRLDE